MMTLFAGTVWGEGPVAGWPSRADDLDVLPGFQNPPPGYGEVPFWWWSGEALDVDRLLWQLHELHAKGVSGVQVNYSHTDTPGWPTDVSEPAIFSDAWWGIYSQVSEECGKLGMGIGLSTYTLDWPWGGENLFGELFYSKPELNAREIHVVARRQVPEGETMKHDVSERAIAIRAYPYTEGKLQHGGIDLSAAIVDGQLSWTAPQGDWEVWEFEAKRLDGTINPLLVDSGARVIQGFFQPFEDNNPGGGSEGLNYFFNDELHIGADKYAWGDDFAEEFKRRKGYDLWEVLPAMWEDTGAETPKVRIDYADVRMALMEERYFKPIYDWHASRGIIFGCDSMGRGTKPQEFGDYFRATRWYSAPGHDTPGGNADLIKGKVSSSVANLYRQPRVWLEGYHSMGWGATPERLMFATRENYLYGCTLLNLHGLYYSTYGSFWEWAPPCYHFHMPYWEHMPHFLGYFDRLSYLLSQGHHVCDVAVVYPVAPYEAEMGGEAAKDTAFALGRALMEAGINFDFIDHQSLARAKVIGERLIVEEAKAEYQALIFPNMDAVRWSSIEKAVEFAEAGGHSLVVGTMPIASDRIGRMDSALLELNNKAFSPDRRFNQATSVVDYLKTAFVQDVQGVGQTVRALHRKAGPRDIYMVMDAEPGTVVEFRATGRVELWDPWTGDVRALRAVGETATGTQVELPLMAQEAQLVVFSPGVHENPELSDCNEGHSLELDGSWTVAFEPTMDNQFGDFRLPVSDENRMIGVEARRFKWMRDEAQSLEIDAIRSDSVAEWREQLHGFGPKFYRLGPLPETSDTAELDARLAQLKFIDPSVPVMVEGAAYHWEQYEFSWRFGHAEDPGHQGFHGLKGKVSQDFIRLGKIGSGPHGTRLIEAEDHQRYYLWTAALSPDAAKVELLTSEAAPAVRNGSPVIAPAAIYLNGEPVDRAAGSVELQSGANPMLLRFEASGQAHVVLRQFGADMGDEMHALAMPWYEDPALIPYDPFAGTAVAEWYHFLSAPGTSAIELDAQADGAPQVWYDGQLMQSDGAGRYTAETVSNESSEIVIRFIPQSGVSGGSAIAEPVRIETNGQGQMRLGDWSKQGVLHNYSGGVRYKTDFDLSAAESKSTMELDLGDLTATAEVHLNGELVGVRVAPPWTFNLSGLSREGHNQLEVLVYNTLSNHYQTIPSSYRGSPESGLFGPVRLHFQEDSD